LEHKEDLDKAKRRRITSDNSRDCVYNEEIKLPIPASHELASTFSDLPQSHPLYPLVASVFSVVDDPIEAPLAILHSLAYAFGCAPQFRHGENAFIAPIDAMLHKFFELLGCTMNRNTGSAHQGTLNHPDVEVTDLGYYGQEKDGVQYQQGSAQKDPEVQLLAGFDFKFWTKFHSDVPKVVGYTYISPSKGSEQLVLGFILQNGSFERDLSLTPFGSHIDFFAAVAWMCQHLPEMRRLKRTWGCPRWRQTVCNDTTEVWVGPDSVLKILKGPRRWEIALLYEALKAREVEFRVSNAGEHFPLSVPTEVRRNDDDVVLRFPLGEVLQNVELSELEKCQLADDVAHGLLILHQMNIVHHDVKLDNVLRNSRRYVLNDLGEGRRFVMVQAQPTDIPGLPLLVNTSHAPRVAEHHLTEVDVWGLAYICEQLQRAANEMSVIAMRELLFEVAGRPGYNLDTGISALNCVREFAALQCAEGKCDGRIEVAAVNACLLCAVCHKYNPPEAGVGVNWVGFEKVWRHAVCQPPNL
jgi:tRNA A-37 threonylcarbamoyl transferase component Bud32